MGLWRNSTVVQHTGHAPIKTGDNDGSKIKNGLLKSLKCRTVKQEARVRQKNVQLGQRKKQDQKIAPLSFPLLVSCIKIQGGCGLLPPSANVHGRMYA